MRYDLDTPFLDLDDEPILDTAGSDATAWTLRTVLARTALFAAPGYPMSAEDKRRGFQIAKQIKRADRIIEVTAEDVALLKGNAGIMWSPLMLGRLEEILENPLTLGLRDAGGPLGPRDKPVSDIPIDKPVP